MCGNGNGFCGGNMCWIVILLILFCCCGGNSYGCGGHSYGCERDGGCGCC